MDAVKNFIYKILDSLYNIKIGILKGICFLLPIKGNKIVFSNFSGRGYGDNPKYILEEIKDRNYDLVWLVSNLDENMPSVVRKVDPNSIKRLYEVATAKVIVTNVKDDLRLIKKKGQYIIQTWHGSYSAKRLEAEAADTLSPRYLKISKKNSAQTDLFLSNSRILSDCYRNAFWCNCEIMECGFPRNDILFSDTTLSKSKIKSALGVPEDSKLVLYAPTFRDNGDVSAYSIDYQAVIEQLRLSGENWKMLIRIHPNVAKDAKLFEYNDHIINATEYPDMQELLFVSDILITDYSSTVFEFAAMGKATYIYAPDIDEYQKMRGLKSDFFDMPYKICTTNKELLDEISTNTPDRTQQKAKEFMRLFGGVDNGTASKQVAERIIQVVNGSFKR